MAGAVRHSAGAQIVVADNASTDGSARFVAENFPEIRLIRSEKNLGFSGGYNFALAQIEADIFVLLNSDAEVTAGWLAPIEREFAARPRLAAAQPKIKAQTDKEYFEYAGAAGGFLDYFGFPFCRGRIFDTLEKDRGQYETGSSVFWAGGACIAVRAEAYRQIGGFDPDFFAHMEEIDLCWRLKNAGFDIRYVPESTVFHVGGGTLPKTSAFKTYLNFRNGLVMMLKNLPAESLFFRLYFRMVWTELRPADFFCKETFLFFGRLFAPIFICTPICPTFCANEKFVGKKQVNDKHPEIFSAGIVYRYFIKGQQKFSELGFRPDKK